MTTALDIIARIEADLALLKVQLQGVPVAPPPTGKPTLTTADFERAAKRLGVPVSTVRAVAEVESGEDGGFDSLGRPTVLFEPHVFSKYTDHRFDATHGGVSYKVWKTKPYPTGTEDERNAANWAKIEYAAKLDRVAAYMSASAGRFQVMGFNWKVCGYPSLDAFWEAMWRSEGDHLDAFVGFVVTNNLARHLVSGDWEAFARSYNGAGQAQAYGAKIALAVEKWSRA